MLSTRPFQKLALLNKFSTGFTQDGATNTSLSEVLGESLDKKRGKFYDGENIHAGDGALLPSSVDPESGCRFLSIKVLGPPNMSRCTKDQRLFLCSFLSRVAWNDRLNISKAPASPVDGSKASASGVELYGLYHLPC